MTSAAQIGLTQLTTEIAPLHAALRNHPLHRTLGHKEALQHFMEHHVFAVWDFMCLLKTLQTRLTCTTVPWTPRKNASHARLINEIVLGEESDEVVPGLVLSHFDLYLRAMSEVGANASCIVHTIRKVEEGFSVGDALRTSNAPAAAQRFVSNTMMQCQGSTIEVAAAFLLGREKLVPEVFENMLSSLQPNEAPSFRLYLERHIQLDAHEHGPAAERMLIELCASEAEWGLAARAARQALGAREQFWNETLFAWEERHADTAATPA